MALRGGRASQERLLSEGEDLYRPPTGRPGRLGMGREEGDSGHGNRASRSGLRQKGFPCLGFPICAQELQGSHVP